MLLHDPNTVTELNLMSNQIGNKGAENIAKLLKQNNSSLMKLNLQNNYISNDGAIKLAEALTVNQTLQEFYIDFEDRLDEDVRDVNLIDPIAEAFAKMLLVNQTLRTLDIGLQLIGHVGISSIAGALQRNRSLFSFCLRKFYMITLW
jgi:Leucine Rich repeat